MMQTITLTDKQLRLLRDACEVMQADIRALIAAERNDPNKYTEDVLTIYYDRIAELRQVVYQLDKHI